MSVPKVRARLRELADLSDLPKPVRRELTKLAEGLKRRRACRRASPSSARMTPELWDTLRAEALEGRETYSAIAARHNVNGGRVSEAANGRRRPQPRGRRK